MFLIIVFAKCVYICIIINNMAEHTNKYQLTIKAVESKRERVYSIILDQNITVVDLYDQKQKGGLIVTVFKLRFKTLKDVFNLGKLISNK